MTPPFLLPISRGSQDERSLLQSGAVEDVTMILTSLTRSRHKGLDDP